ncbi:hypothetical protein E4U43_006364 [Claviceps pusilla]|uniref:Uncharacterized protein n=1 Tax=Claviceps pusilla TaxID=123648 RepID=A0A9P7STK4_9HYPO|nr:hypothetical protein E4U43_006364 [Claviceps pusilla]
MMKRNAGSEESAWVDAGSRPQNHPGVFHQERGANIAIHRIREAVLIRWCFSSILGLFFDSVLKTESMESIRNDQDQGVGSNGFQSKGCPAWQQIMWRRAADRLIIGYPMSSLSRALRAINKGKMISRP